MGEIKGDIHRIRFVALTFHLHPESIKKRYLYRNKHTYSLIVLQRGVQFYTIKSLIFKTKWYENDIQHLH